MFRKIVGSMLVGLLALIIFKIGWLPAVIDAIIYGKYKYYDFKIDFFGLLHTQNNILLRSNFVH